MRGKENKDSIESQFSTRAHEVIWANFKDLISKVSFQCFIKVMRDERDKSMLYDKRLRKKRFKSSEHQREFILFQANSTKELCKRNNLHYTDFVDLIDHYIVFDEIPKPFDFENAYNLCIVEDETDKKQKCKNKYWQESDDLMYPVSIRINPNVGVDMLKDFVDKVFNTHIKLRQERYLSKETKIKILRKRKCEHRDNFIVEHRNNVEEINEFIFQTCGKTLSNSEINEIIRRKLGTN